ncbi:Hypothetical predicted protein [Mytilus galloprovincialis]|uniref:DZIP3-like HEPN domain-containing protein n=1 Tax=Mytilus galloprovincialis TaxID=29158 RepID=A0A8B6CAX0_MYTGA|nr:Hypothetical predicted protein [Mytilus galloprovincialis]
MSLSVERRLHAKLGWIVLKVFPKVMQWILTAHIGVAGLHTRYRNRNYNLQMILTDNENNLMQKLPKIDEFTIELCYKILRSENYLHSSTDASFSVDETVVSDDIRCILLSTNDIIKKESRDITQNYAIKHLYKFELLLRRIDKFLNENGNICRSLYHEICKENIDELACLDELKKLQLIEVGPIISDRETQERERFSRIAVTVTKLFPEILREIITLNYKQSGKHVSSKFSGKAMHKDLQQYWIKFNSTEKNMLRKMKKSKEYNALDVTIMCKIIRLMRLVPCPRHGWDKPPGNTDNDIGDNIVRIYFLRNEIVHSPNTCVTSTKMDNYFTKFREISIAMDTYFRGKSVFAKFEEKVMTIQNCFMDHRSADKYIQALTELENIKLRFTCDEIKFYWGDTFDLDLREVRGRIKEEKEKGKDVVNLHLFVRDLEDPETKARILNGLSDELRTMYIKFKWSAAGSLLICIDVHVRALETNEQLETELSKFIQKMKGCKALNLSSVNKVSAVMIAIEVEAEHDIPQAEQVESSYTTMSKSHKAGLHLTFEASTSIFETDENIEKEVGEIVNRMLKRSNGKEEHGGVSASLVQLGSETTEEINGTVSLRSEINLKTSSNEILYISDCIVIEHQLVFTDRKNKQLITCSSNGGCIRNIPLSWSPWYITNINSDTVAVSYPVPNKIQIISLSTGTVTCTFEIIGCRGISYNCNDLYISVALKGIQVLDLSGNLLRTIPSPSDNIYRITIHEDRLFCVHLHKFIVYCCDINGGKVIWKFANEKYKTVLGATTDDQGNLYMTGVGPNNVVMITPEGKHEKELLTASYGLHYPHGIYYDKTNKCLLLADEKDGKAFLFNA